MMNRIALNTLATPVVLLGGWGLVSQPTLSPSPTLTPVAAAAAAAADDQTAVGPYRQVPWSATLEAESDPSLGLARVTGLAVDSKHRVYVTDGAWDGIVVLGADLTFEQEVGRMGEGPGEFDWLVTIQILAGDSLYVFDGGLARVTVFEPRALAVAYTITLPHVAPAAGLWRIPRQGGYVGLRRLRFHATQRADDQGRIDVVFSLGKTGEMESDSLYAVPSAEALIVRGQGSVMVGPHPYGAEPFLSLLGADRLVYANSRFPSVEVLDLAGAVRNSFAVPATAVPVSAAELKARIESEEREAFARVLEQGAPHTWPALTGLVVDDEQRIWVGERSESTSGEWEWTAFAQEGSVVGSVLLPSGFDLYAVRGDRLFGVITDELDVPRIQVYRLEGE